MDLEPAFSDLTRSGFEELETLVERLAATEMPSGAELIKSSNTLNLDGVDKDEHIHAANLFGDASRSFVTLLREHDNNSLDNIHEIETNNIMSVHQHFYYGIEQISTATDVTKENILEHLEKAQDHFSEAYHTLHDIPDIIETTLTLSPQVQDVYEGVFTDSLDSFLTVLNKFYLLVTTLIDN
jgi:hypothetical protein